MTLMMSDVKINMNRLSVRWFPMVIMMIRMKNGELFYIISCKNDNILKMAKGNT